MDNPDKVMIDNCFWVKCGVNMKRFILKADCSFDAENINDACLKISEHFRRLVQDEDYDEFLLKTGEIYLAPLEGESEEK